MRIIAGSLGGRVFDSPKSHVSHPMSERVRGGLFNVLGDISGLSVLDTFAGSGALGFEALSRGAQSAVLVDNDRSAQKIIIKNIEVLGLSDQAKLIKASLGAWLETANSETFDLILADPPYDHLQLQLLERLFAYLKSTGTLVLSWPGKQALPVLGDLKQVAVKNYGDAQLIFYRPA